MGRRELREHIFRLLFRRDFFPEEEMKEQEAFYIEYLADPEQKEVDYIVQKTEKIMAMIPELDTLVNEHSVGWQTERMGKVDLTIIRLAVYEMKYDDDIPVSVAINEAVELAKEYKHVIYVGGLNHDQDLEGQDRADLTLPYGQDRLITELLEVRSDMTIVMLAGSPVSMNHGRTGQRQLSGRVTAVWKEALRLQRYCLVQ